MKLVQRPRRLRTDKAIRNLIAEVRLAPTDFIWPLFIHAQAGTEAIAAMPGVARLDGVALLRACEDALAAGIPAVALFPAVIPELCTADGAEAWNDNGLVQNQVQAVKKQFPELLVVVDVALDPYTTHGHDGLMTPDGIIDNDATVQALVRQAVSLAAAGADIVAPSDMMDGRIGAIRDALEEVAFKDTKIMSYAAKYSSAFYGPFRQAIGSGKRLQGDKRTYQMDPANVNEALREIRLDIEEGADLVIVKPGLPYLDVIRAAALDCATTPLFAYQVSGEYAMIEAAAANGWLEREAAMFESLLAFKRAGCAGILTYYALQAAQSLRT